MICIILAHITASYPTSIITRIETLTSEFLYLLKLGFLPHFHYNKDWNNEIGGGKMGGVAFLPHFHYNKDWNDPVVCDAWEKVGFLPHFHYNKDWNTVE